MRSISGSRLNKFLDSPALDWRTLHLIVMVQIGSVSLLNQKWLNKTVNNRQASVADQYSTFLFELWSLVVLNTYRISVRILPHPQPQLRYILLCACASCRRNMSFTCVTWRLRVIRLYYTRLDCAYVHPRGLYWTRTGVVFVNLGAQEWCESWNITKKSYWRKWTLCHGRQTPTLEKFKSSGNITSRKEMTIQSRH